MYADAIDLGARLREQRQQRAEQEKAEQIAQAERRRALRLSAAEGSYEAHLRNIRKPETDLGAVRISFYSPETLNDGLQAAWEKFKQALAKHNLRVVLESNRSRGDDTDDAFYKLEVLKQHEDSV
jgi:hypothetical protein